MHLSSTLLSPDMPLGLCGILRISDVPNPCSSHLQYSVCRQLGKMGVVYELRGLPEAASPDEWRVTYFETRVSQGRKHKLGRPSEPGEKVLLRLRMEGLRET